MSLSRTEQRQREKQRHQKKRRRFASFVLIAAGIVLLSAGVYISVSKEGGGLGEQLAQLANGGNGKSGADDKGRDDPAGGKGDGAEAVNGLPGEDGASEPVGENDEDGGNSSNGEGEDGVTGGEIASPPNGAEQPGAGEGAVTVSLSFFGDLMPGEYVNPLMKQHGFDYPYREVLLYLSEPDITAGNLELPITLRGTPVKGTPYVYKGSPEVLPSLYDAGIDVLSLATNHALDQGVEGLLDTMKHLDEAGIGHFGAGRDDKEAFAPLIREAKGMKVAYIGLTRVIPYPEWKADRNVPGVAETYDTTRAVAAISKAKEEADLVVVMVHWGVDGADRPESYQRQFAREYIDAGADLVIGSHPHVLQGFEMYNGKWIAYSLGNFLFEAYPKGPKAESGVLDAVCSAEGECELKFNPMIVEQGQPKPLSGESAAKLLARLGELSYGASMEPDGRILPSP